MIVIIKNLSASTMVSHLKEFIRPVVRGGFFQRKVTLENVLIYKHALVTDNDIEYYALVSIEPDSVGKRMIGALHKKMLHGNSVVVEQYHDRQWHNDRRNNNACRAVKVVYERRKGERRRRHINVEINSDTVS